MEAMALFHVERYSGDAVISQVATVDKDQEESRLELLRQKVKKRKLSRISTSNSALKSSDVALEPKFANRSVTEDDKRANKKQDNLSENLIDNYLDRNTTDSGVCETAKKKKKKKIKQTECLDELSNGNVKDKSGRADIEHHAQVSSDGNIELDVCEVASVESPRVAVESRTKAGANNEKEKKKRENKKKNMRVTSDDNHTNDHQPSLIDIQESNEDHFISSSFGQANLMETEMEIDHNEKPLNFTQDLSSTTTSAEVASREISGDSVNENDASSLWKEESSSDSEDDSELQSQSHVDRTEETEEKEIDTDSNLSHENKNGNTSFFQILGTDQRRPKVANVKRTLPKWVREPVVIDGSIHNNLSPVDSISSISEKLRNKLILNGVKNLFPVQVAVVPYVISQCMQGSIYGLGGLPPRDICVSAPTGSGKTLAYVIPIVQILSSCNFRRLQALIVVPSKELVTQIKNVFVTYTQGSDLRVGVASGLHSFLSEQKKLVQKSGDHYFSNIDILVCTPGRLVDHLLRTDGFTLEHIRFLVIDEADRLLSQDYSSWCNRIMEEVYLKDKSNSRFKDLVPCTASFLETKLPFQKLLFSATLTHNPEKLAPLRLHRPILFAACAPQELNNIDVTKASTLEGVSKTDRYVVPNTLTQKMHVCSGSLKPLVVLYLMTVKKYRGVLCFTKSIETTHRLFLLTKAFGGIKAAEFSSALTQAQRKQVIKDFMAGEIDLLIASDAMARGMDVQNVKVVISYDPPVNVKTYIHRIGRTARAGQEGTAISMLEKREVFHFRKEINKLGHKGLPNLGLKYKELAPLRDKYEIALEKLSTMVNEERRDRRGHKRKQVACTYSNEQLDQDVATVHGDDSELSPA